MGALEEQVRGLSETVRSLEAQLATVAERNRQLEAAHIELANYRAESDREVAERAAATLRDAEERARLLTAGAQHRAAMLEAEARDRSLELIEAVGSEIDALERESERVRTSAATDGSEPAATEPAASPEEPDAAATVRGQIADLLRLRESIVNGIRGAVAGVDDELARLERPPLAAVESPSEEAADAADGPGGSETPAEWDGFTISVEVEPVAGVLEASRIEQNLAAISAEADAHLRSVEGGRAALSVWGLGPQQLREAIDSRFPGASCEWVAEDRVTMRLSPAEVA